jgi:hypothetical protein
LDNPQKKKAKALEAEKDIPSAESTQYMLRRIPPIAKGYVPNVCSQGGAATGF